MNKFKGLFAAYKAWKSTPITWGSYLKLCKYSMLASLLYLLVFYAWIFRENIKEWINSKKPKSWDEKAFDESVYED